MRCLLIGPAVLACAATLACNSSGGGRGDGGVITPPPGPIPVFQCSVREYRPQKSEPPSGTSKKRACVKSVVRSGCGRLYGPDGAGKPMSPGRLLKSPSGRPL